MIFVSIIFTVSSMNNLSISRENGQNYNRDKRNNRIFHEILQNIIKMCSVGLRGRVGHKNLIRADNTETEF